MMDAPSITTPHPGPRTQEFVKRLRAVEAGAGLTYGLSDDPIFLDHAEGAVITDPDGNRFLDMVAGFGSLNLGHSHPAIVEAVRIQVGHGQQAMSIGSTTRTELLEKMAGLVAGDYRVILAASGSEAAEVALKMTRRATGRQGIVAFSGGFHGRTMGALTLMGRQSQRDGLGTLLAGAIHLPFPDPFRSPFGTDPQQISDTTLALLDQQLGDPASGWMPVGAVIIESVQGNGGMIPVPAGFMSGLRDICTRHGILLIADEVMSGFHRTGSLFAYQRDDDVDPDIIILGKSLSAGLPLAGCLISSSISDSNPVGTESSTYAGNLVSCAAALAALQVYESFDVSKQAQDLGEYFQAELRAAVGDHRNVGTIRGRGLMVAVELVSDRDGRTPLPVARAVSHLAIQRGLLLYPGGHFGNALAFLPPLIVTRDQLSTAASVMADVINSATFDALETATD
jgi:4-aminobutyrate aminotransferase-like enzyme